MDEIFDMEDIQNEDDNFFFEDKIEVQKILYDTLNEELKTYRDFLEYLTNRACGDITKIVQAVGEVSHFKSMGYVSVIKKIKSDGSLAMTFKINDREYTAGWEPSENYAVFQVNDYWCDSYDGYLLFPTGKELEYFCVYFND